MKKILITGAIHPVGLERLEKEKDLHVDYKPDLPREDILKIIGDYDCIMSRSETTIDQEMIDKGKKLSVIARAAVGFGNIDVDYATKQGILVFNTPGKNTNSAAELTVMLALAVIRNLINAHQSMAENKWNRHHFTGTELLGKKVGIIGLGNVGHRVARFMNSFDCEVMSYDPYISDERFEKHHARKVSFEELLRESDIITLHVPKNKETTGMISRKEIALMKDGVIIINPARGGVVDEKALEEGMASGKVMGAGIDTWDVEPVKEHPLKKFPHMVMTPHIGASTLEAQQRIAETVTEETIKALRGEVVNTPVNMPKMGVLSPRLIQYTVLTEKLGMISRQMIGNEFQPHRFEFLYRGKLDKTDWALIKLSFMKGFLKGTVDTEVSYVNALQIAEDRGFEIIEEADKAFSDYESAIRVKMTSGKNQMSIGGTVFGKKLRLSYLNGYPFEIEPTGTILIIQNYDSPGVVGHLGKVLSDFQVNINQFELSRDKKGGKAMALVLIDEDISQEVVEKLSDHSSIYSLKKVVL